MCYNENARIIEEGELNLLVARKLSVMFPQIAEKLNRMRSALRVRQGDEMMTIKAALFGFNTVKGSNGSGDAKTDYFVTADRKALTIGTVAQISLKEDDGYLNNDNVYLK